MIKMPQDSTNSNGRGSSERSEESKHYGEAVHGDVVIAKD